MKMRRVVEAICIGTGIIAFSAYVASESAFKTTKSKIRNILNKESKEEKKEK